MFATQDSVLTTLRTDGVTLDLAQLLTYQRLTYLVDLAPRQQIQSKLAGSYLARSKGRGMEFDEVRHYQNGDDVRTIDWRVTARTGKVHTKLFREEKERPVFVLTDLGPSMQFGSVLLTKAVQAAHLAALLGWHARERGDKFGGIVLGNTLVRELKPAGRSAAVLRYLQQLIELNNPSQSPQNPPVTLAQACGQLRRLVRPGSLVYLLSDFANLDDNTLRHLQSLRQHNEVRLCRLVDPLERQLPAQSRGNVRVTDGVQQLALHIGSRALQQHYQQQQHLQYQQQDTVLQRLGLPTLEISTALSLREQLSGLGSTATLQFNNAVSNAVSKGGANGRR